MTNTLNKIVHNGDEYEFPGIPNDTTGTTSIVSNIWAGTSSEYNLITPKEGQLSIVLHEEGGGGWQPGANTMLYLPMDTDLLDHSGNSLTVNNLGSVSLVSTGTGASVPVAQFNSTSTELTFAYQGNINSAWTMSFWENTTNQNTNAQFITAGSWSYHRLFQIGYVDSPTRGLTLSNYGEDVNLGSYTGRDGTWHLITATYSGVSGQTNNAKVYIDGVLAMQGTMQGWLWTDNTFMIGNYNQETAMGGYLSKFIVETAERTAQEVSDYFDLTKGDYGIGGGGWTPGANTIAYFPMDTDLLDHSGNSFSVTTYGNVSIGTVGGVSAGYFGGVGELSGSFTYNNTGLTAMGYAYKTANPNNDNGAMFGFAGGNMGGPIGQIDYFNTNGPANISNKPGVALFDWSTQANQTAVSMNNNEWVHFAMTLDKDTKELKLYTNGVLSEQYTTQESLSSINYLGMSRANGIDRSWIGYFSNVIFEDKLWTSQEILDYFNLTKGDYGIGDGGRQPGEQPD